MALDHSLARLARWIWTPDAAIFDRLKRGARWSIFGESGSRALSVLAAAIVARLLGVIEFGGYSLIQGCLAMFMTFAAFGIGHTTARYVAALKSSDPLRIPEIVSLSVLFSTASGLLWITIMWLAAPTLASVVLDAPELGTTLRLAAPALLFASVAGAFNGVIGGMEAFDWLAKQAWMVGVATFVAVVAGVMAGGLNGAALGMAVGEAVHMALAAYGARVSCKLQGLPLFAGAGFGHAKILWMFSLPTVISGVLHVGVLWICQALIAGAGGALGEIGVYSAAQKWMTLVTFVPTAASAAVGPVLASLSKDGDSHSTTTLRVAALQAITCAIPAVVVASYATFAMGIFGTEFVQGGHVLVVMMVLAPISVVVRLTWSSLLSLERAWTSCLLWLLWAHLAVGLTWLCRA